MLRAAKFERMSCTRHRSYVVKSVTNPNRFGVCALYGTLNNSSLLIKMNVINSSGRFRWRTEGFIQQTEVLRGIVWRQEKKEKIITTYFVSALNLMKLPKDDVK